jgi:uncharacterized damage-inducible protein DinB
VESIVTNSDGVIREQLVELLRGKGAHLSFDEAIAGLSLKLRGVRPEGVPHSVWRLVEHMRIAQKDILEFSKDGRHKSPKWPERYWPKGDGPADAKQWNESVKAFRADLKEMIRVVKDKKVDLLSPIPGGQGQTVFREAMLVADHNSYHLGQIVVVRRILGAWED